MNCSVIIGRLTRDPDLRYTPGNGKAVATFTVAVNRPVKNKEGHYEADFIRVQVWGALAENCTKYLVKGQQAGVKGRLQTRSYDNSQGAKQYITEIVAESVDFLGKPEGYEGTNGSQPEIPGGYEPVSFDDDDIPF